MQSNHHNYVRRLLFFVIILQIFIIPSPVHAQAVVIDPFFSMDARYVTDGQSFDVPINFGTNTAVRSIGFDISYDPAVVRLDGVSEGAFFSAYALANNGFTKFFAGSNDPAAGRLTGLIVSLVGTTGGPVNTAGVVAVIHFTALNVHARQTTGLLNFHIIDTSGADLAAYSFVTGGLVQVGIGPQLSITSLAAQPTGVGPDVGKTFQLSFTITNVDGIVSIPGTATISVFGATPGFQQLPVPAIIPNQSVTIVVPGDFSMVGSPKIGDLASITVAVTGDGNRIMDYTYQPVLDIKNTNVDAYVLPFMQLTVPTLVNWLDLQPGLNQSGGTINVRCNTSYQVDVVDTNPTQWRMTEWDGAGFLSNRMNEPLHVVFAAQARDVSLGTPATLFSGTVADQSLDNGKDYLVSFQQTRHKSDAALSANHLYHLVLTINGYILF